MRFYLSPTRASAGRSTFSYAIHLGDGSLKQFIHKGWVWRSVASTPFYWAAPILVDDVALFNRPQADDLQLTKELLQIFGEASGLQTSLQKSCLISIQCDNDIVDVVNQSLHCTISAFPTTYLGLPISDKKLRMCDLLAWIEKIANKLLGWKYPCLNFFAESDTPHPCRIPTPVSDSKCYLPCPQKF